MLSSAFFLTVRFAAKGVFALFALVVFVSADFLDADFSLTFFLAADVPAVLEALFFFGDVSFVLAADFFLVFTAALNGGA